MEARWKGSRYNSNISVPEIGKLFKIWAKENYPNCKFGVRTTYNSIDVSLKEANFQPFVDESKTYIQINHYWLKDDVMLTKECKGVMENAISYLNSFNYDNSDVMSDYFSTNFYLTVAIGSWDKHFKYIPSGEKKSIEKKRATTEKDKKINAAMKGATWGDYQWGRTVYENILVKESDSDRNSAFRYSSDKKVEKRASKLRDAGFDISVLYLSYSNCIIQLNK